MATVMSHQFCTDQLRSKEAASGNENAPKHASAQRNISLLQVCLCLYSTLLASVYTLLRGVLILAMPERRKFTNQGKKICYIRMFLFFQGYTKVRSLLANNRLRRPLILGPLSLTMVMIRKRIRASSGLLGDGTGIYMHSSD